MKTSPTAAIIVIGNEILSGKTQDANISYIGSALASLGIILVEACVIRDDHEMIIACVKKMSDTYTYVFTTGGIGPTHDDITAKAVAEAFDRELLLNEQAAKLIGGDRDHPRMKMAMIPAGAELVENSHSRAPGFHIANVYVLAGVPAVAQAMFEEIRPKLVGGAAIVSANADVFMRESDIAAPLSAIAEANPELEIGSYPFARDGVFGANLVVRGDKAAQVDAVMCDIVDSMVALGAKVERKA